MTSQTGASDGLARTAVGAGYTVINVFQGVGAAAGNELTISITLTPGTTASGFVVTKIGAGTAICSAGHGNNSYPEPTVVDEGTLVLGKSVGINAMSGTLVVGGLQQRTATAKVGTNYNQFATTIEPVIVNGAGTLDLTGVTAPETIGALDVRGGTVKSSTTPVPQVVLNPAVTGGSYTLTVGAFTTNFFGNIAAGIAQNATITATGAVEPAGSNVATITTTGMHGFKVGDSVIIQGVGTAGFNSTAAAPWIVTSVPTPNTFTFSTGATTGLGNSGGGTINTATIAVGAAIETGNIATITTSTAHGYSIGQTIMIEGVAPAAYNGIYTILSVPTPTTFTYALPFGSVSLPISTTAGTAFPANAAALAMQNALALLPNVGAGNVTVTPQTGTGFTFNVAFANSVLYNPMPLMSGAGANLTGNTTNPIFLTGMTVNSVVTGLASTSTSTISGVMVLGAQRHDQHGRQRHDPGSDGLRRHGQHPRLVLAHQGRRAGTLLLNADSK